ncbi:hypothetical protein KIN20_000655 [Parelaphostrongylus tenuis]|uniref:Uncharacterized protein n=1 Tax=Parelaphostrongylus tenuis TaxID=148309 RepID=A0AAD5MBK7_PARTN|nr:hypothetical protein KIN20_000655 [Parelaphostrongylus tenuis]
MDQNVSSPKQEEACWSIMRGHAWSQDLSLKESETTETGSDRSKRSSDYLVYAEYI